MSAISPQPETTLASDTPAADAVLKPSTRLKLRKPWVIAIVAGLIVSAIGLSSWSLMASRKPHYTATPVTIPPSPTPPPPTPTPTPTLSALTGLPVSPAAAQLPVTAVVIENHPDARPQSGLSQAGVVYEALAEGGITRFLAFFADQQPPVLGPVRSLRTYFIDWALEFNAPVAHAGGNADALDLVGPLDMKNIDGLTFASSYFYRTRDRYAPHNFYTTSDLIAKADQSYHYNTPPSFTLSPRKKDEPGNPTHPNIHINYSYNGYQVDYKYDPTTNDYARFLAGSPHIDRNTGTQIHVKNVVVEYMPTSYGFTRINEQTVIMRTVGTGKAIVFRDGTAVVGTWSKAAHSSRTELLDASGQPIALDAGNTWYSIVPTDKTVSY